MTTLFVTSSGTDIGKTFVTVQLIGELRAAGYRTRALKPIATGFDTAAVAQTDTGRLLHALNLPATATNVDSISPWRFAAPLSPDMAAEREHRAIPFGELVDFCRTATTADVTLIEGIGGVMVPLDREHTVVDWIAALRAPALLVVGSYLGTLSHTLTAIAALRERGCTLAAVIVDESTEQPVPLTETAATIRRFTPGVPILTIPRWRDGVTTTPLLPALQSYWPKRLR